MLTAMIYICAGMYRSGSTWLYNAVRLLLENARAPDLAAGWIADRERLFARKNSVVKIHEYSHELASGKNIVLTSHRDLRDIAASLCRKFKSAFSMDTLREAVAAHAHWARVASYDLRYENLLADKLTELKNVARALRLSEKAITALPFDSVLKQIDQQEFSEKRSTAQRFDSVTLLHDGHITDGRHGSWADILPADVVRAIETEFRPWLVQRGYLN